MARAGIVIPIVSLATASHATAQYLGSLSANPYDPNSTSNAYGARSLFDADSIKNLFERYGSRFRPNGVTNPYATETRDCTTRRDTTGAG